MVPFHPVLLMLTNIHCNVQVVNDFCVTRYLLKYTVKDEPSGPISVDDHLMAQICFHGLSYPPAPHHCCA